MSYELMPHQRSGLLTALKRKCWGFFWDCGTGKTCLGLNIARRAKPYGATLVVCPVSIIKAAWIEDAAKFTTELSIVNMHTKLNTKGKQKLLTKKEREQRLKEDHDIFVMNFETLKSCFEAVKAKGFYCIIIDESSRMKSARSQTTRALLSLAGIKTSRPRKSKLNFKPPEKPIPRRFTMSGTPAPNDYIEYWSQVKFITGAGGSIFNDNFYAFRSRYFNEIPLGITGQKIFKFRANMESEFKNKIAAVSEAIDKDDVLEDLPPMTKQKRIISLGKKERQAYDDFVKELVLQVQNEEVLATNTLVQTLQLREITSGFVYSQQNGKPLLIGDSKLKELQELLEDIGDHQVIIWANFKHEIKTLLKTLPGSRAIWGGDKDRDETIADFQNGRFQYLIANPASAAHGLTFTNSRYAIYFSLNYSYEQQKQSEDRIRRKGQTNQTTAYFLIAENTIDEVIYKAVEKKADLNKSILGYLKNE